MSKETVPRSLNKVFIASSPLRSSEKSARTWAGSNQSTSNVRRQSNMGLRARTPGEAHGQTAGAGVQALGVSRARPTRSRPRSHHHAEAFRGRSVRTRQENDEFQSAASIAIAWVHRRGPMRTMAEAWPSDWHHTYSKSTPTKRTAGWLRRCWWRKLPGPMP
jgi:hypothetical protein